jgi:foldase protein PrsA
MSAMKSARSLLTLVFVAVLALSAAALTGCNSNKGVAARVNGQVISTTQLQAQVDQLKKQYPQMFTGTDAEGRLLDFKRRLMDNLVNQALIEQAAKEKGITVSDADVQKQIDQLKSGFKDQATFEQALKSANMTLDTLKTQIKTQLITQKLVNSFATNTKVTPAELLAYYDANKTQFFQKAAKRASQILFKPEDKATATKVLAELKAGGDFATLAKKYSVDTATASKGGDLGWPTTSYVPEFQAALDKLSKGQMSGLVQSPYGWHIILVTDTRSGAQQTLDQVKSQIEQILLQQRKADAYQKFLNDLRKAAKIDIVETDLKTPATSPTQSNTPSSTTK